MPDKRTRLLALIAFQLLILGGMFANGLHPLLFGQEVVLRSQARDPRSLLSGNYVVLNYGFDGLNLVEDLQGRSDIDTAKESFNYGDVLFLELAPDGEGFHRAVGLWKKPPPGATVLRTIVINYDEGSDGDSSMPRKHSFNLQTGIESYFANKKLALALDSLNRLDGLAVSVYLTESGAARVAQVKAIPPAPQAQPDATSP